MNNWISKNKCPGFTACAGTRNFGIPCEYCEKNSIDRDQYLQSAQRNNKNWNKNLSYCRNCCQTGTDHKKCHLCRNKQIAANTRTYTPEQQEMLDWIIKELGHIGIEGQDLSAFIIQNYIEIIDKHRSK